MNGGHSYAASVTNNEGEVWVTGGWRLKKLDEERHETSEILTRGGTWISGSNLTSSRYQHCGVVLADGTVIFTGGSDQHEGALRTVERYRLVLGSSLSLYHLLQV